jgi:hypothetical protein
MLIPSLSGQEKWQELKYDCSKAPADNPLKGFMPYAGDGLNGEFPFSMEWFYLGFNEIMKGPNSFNFEHSLEVKLNESAARGKQSVFRIYLDYPSKKHAVPEFLIANGHKMIQYKNDDADNKGGFSPDYTDENLIVAMEASIAEMGRLYDGDPRIGFITIGYLGHWGEWHTYPNDHLMAKRDVQVRILKAFYGAFKTTKYLLRYPNKVDLSSPCGFHDDSFACETLYDKKKDWRFMTQIEAGEVQDAWKTQAIGGELYPPFQKKLWSTPSKKAENYDECVKATHCSWLINNAVFNSKWKSEEKVKAIQGAKALGYQFYAESYRLDKGTLKVRIQNKGVAPFYYKWPVDIVDHETKETIQTDWDIRSILPGQSQEFSVQFKGNHPALRIANPMPNGLSLRFANETQTEEYLILE